jgi:hypothetical protein
MPPTDENYTAFIVGLGAGDERFASRLIALARAELDSRIRQKVDPEDVLQSVYKSFFRRHAEGEFDLDGWDRLWAVLATITINKCRRWPSFGKLGPSFSGKVKKASWSPTCAAGWPTCLAVASHGRNSP